MKQKLISLVKIARVDHWPKNAFMLPGFFIALFSQEVFKFDLPSFVIGLLSLCLVSSSNYVLNELLDAKTDRAHKEKSKRPVATGLVSLNEGLILWGLLAIASFFLSFHLSPSFGLSVAALWIAGCCYNTPPIRLKDIAYADVLSESINSPIRFLAGWFLVLETQLPPLSILIAYWFATAFFLAAKRYAEFGSFASREQATAYRKSFAHYSENMLLIHLVFYITTGAFFGGIFIVRHRPELIVIIPLVASFFAYYLKLSLQKDSPVQSPEKLIRLRFFLLLCILILISFIALLIKDIPIIYEIFNLNQSGQPLLWKIR